MAWRLKEQVFQGIGQHVFRHLPFFFLFALFFAFLLAEPLASTNSKPVGCRGVDIALHFKDTTLQEMVWQLWCLFLLLWCTLFHHPAWKEMGYAVKMQCRV